MSAQPGAHRVVLGVSGGIAAYKAVSLLRMFTESGYDVTVVPTLSALQFVGAPTWSALSGKPVTSEVFDDVHQVRHVRLGQDADLVVVAPATADLLAKAAHGLANDLLTNVLLTAHCPVVMAPAMHTEMWQHPATVANVATLRARGVHVVEPASGRLTGTDSGPGRLPEPQDIYRQALLALETSPGGESPTQPGMLAGRTVMVTAGGTREALDPVRYLGNRSSGKQGYALAEAALDAGAQVVLVSANVSLPVPDGAQVVPVESARELEAAVMERLHRVDVLVMAAAVADFRPARYAESKIKKEHGPGHDDDAPVIELVRNPDILAGAVRQRGAAGERTPYIVGFAAETGDDTGSVVDLARAKLARKGCDLLVANEVGRDLTFGQDTSTAHLLRPGTDEIITVGPASKHDVARSIWQAVAQGLAQQN